MTKTLFALSRFFQIQILVALWPATMRFLRVLSATFVFYFVNEFLCFGRKISAKIG